MTDIGDLAKRLEGEHYCGECEDWPTGKDANGEVTFKDGLHTEAATALRALSLENFNMGEALTRMNERAAKLEKEDEIHWKTRRSLLRELASARPEGWKLQTGLDPNNLPGPAELLDEVQP